MLGLVAQWLDPPAGGLLSSKKRSYTKLFGNNWRLIYKEEYNTREEALIREKELKSYRGREFVKKNILGW